MTILPQLRDRASVVRRVTVNGTDAQVTELTDQVQWPALLVEARRRAPAEATSVREEAPGALWYPEGWREPPGGPLNAADRVQMADGAVYEVLGASERLRHARRQAGWSAPVRLVSLLYPVAAELQAQGGTQIAPDMPLEIWSPTETHQDRGTVEQLSANAPIEYYEELRERNRWLIVAGVRHHVTTCVLDYSGPRAVLTLRRVDG